MTEQEKRAEVWAQEQTAYEYLQQALHAGWTATRTKGEFDDWDVTVTNNTTGKKVLVENKIRNIDADYVRNEGAMVNVDKVERIQEQSLSAYIIQYFWRNNETYKWSTDESDSWKQQEMWARENSWTDRKAKKWRYLLPMDDEHRLWNVDLSDYAERYEYNYSIGLQLYATRV